MSPDAERDEILAEVAEAFRTPRPDWFCDARHCCECAEHEAELQAETVETLRREVLGDGAWDPVAFIKNPDGFKYFMPALARLAYGTGQDYFLTSFMFHLRPDRIETFTERQRTAIEKLLIHLSVAIASEIERCNDFHELEWALRRIRGEPGPCSYEGQA
jgi:hypothetical protein